MNMTLFCVHLITNCIINFILLNYLSEQYAKKYIRYFYDSIFIISSISLSIINLLNIPILNLIMSFTFFLAVDVIGFKHQTIVEYCRDMIYLLILIFLDTIAFFLVGFIYSSHEDINIFRTLSSTLLVLLFNMIIKKYIYFTKIEDVPLREIIIYLVITVFYIFLIYILSKDYDLVKNQFSKSMILFIVIAHVLIDTVIYYYLNFVGLSYKIEKEMIEANKQIEIKNIYYTNLKRNYEENRKIIHDFKNHLQILEYTYEHNFQKAQKIKEEIIKKLDNNKMKYQSSSEILDIILMDKEKESEKNQIQFDFKMEIVDLSFISDMDIITMFGNLFDNAIEANENDEKNKYISTIIYQINETLIIRMENSCINLLKQTLNKIESTKANHKGIGIRNVKDTIEKYDGVFDINIHDNKCILIISIPLTAKK